MRATRAALFVIPFLVLALPSVDGGDGLAVWIDAQGQPAECAAVKLQEELARQPDMYSASSKEKATVRVKLTSCRQQAAAVVPPPGIKIAGIEYVIHAEVTEGDVTTSLHGMDGDSWRGAARGLCRAIAIWHRHQDQPRDTRRAK